MVTLPSGSSLRVFIACALLLVLVVLTLAENALAPLFQYDRSAILNGAYYRLWSAHFIHFGWYHALFNSLGLFVFGWLLLGRSSFALWGGVLIVSPVVISCLMLWFNADISVYRGFSGVFYTLLVFGVLESAKANWRGSLVLGLAVLAKLVIEQWPGYDVDYLREHIGVPVMVDAHMYGACTGLIYYLLFWCIKNRYQKE